MNVADLPVLGYAQTKQPNIKLAFPVYTNRSYGWPTRPEDVEFRNELESVLEGMKLDGTFAELHKEWFGDLPGEDSTMNKVWVGYGMPGFKGYTFEPHKPQYK